LAEHGCPSQDYAKLDELQLKSHFIIPSIAVVLKLQYASESLGALLKHRFLGPISMVSDSVSLELGLRIHLPNRCPVVYIEP